MTKRELLTAAGVFDMIGDAAVMAYDYLEYFGWLPKLDQVTVDDVVRAATDFQDFTGHLTPDGVIGPKTLAVMQLPRCGCRDVQRQGGALNRWAIQFKNGQKLKYRFENFLPHISRHDQTDAAQVWYDQWSEIGGVEAEPVNAGEHAHVLIAFSSSRRDEFGVPGRVLAWHEMPQGDFDPRNTLRMRFDAVEPWYVGRDKLGQSLIGTGCHEAGHGWGIDHGGDGLMQPFAVDGLDAPRPGYDYEQIKLRHGDSLRGDARPENDTLEVRAKTPDGKTYDGTLVRTR